MCVPSFCVLLCAAQRSDVAATVLCRAALAVELTMLRSEQVASTASVFRGFGSKLGASFKSLSDSFVKLDTPAYGASSPTAATAAQAPYVAPKATAAAQPVVPQPAASNAATAAPAAAEPPAVALPAAGSAAQGPAAAAPAKPEEAFSLGACLLCSSDLCLPSSFFIHSVGALAVGTLR